MQSLKLIFILCFWVILSACGGGGSASPTNSSSSSVALQTTFTVVVSASFGGSYILQATKVVAGQTNKVTAIPDSGYILNSFSGCGVGVVNYNDYTTAPINSDCSIAITFKKANAIEGTAAEGVVLADADVIAKCADGSGFSSAIKTDSLGHFTGLVGESAFPCALKLTSASQEKIYVSLALATGTTNITLLTDLILALASGVSGVEWFAEDAWVNVVAKLDDAELAVRNRFYDMGYLLPAEEFKPFTIKFIIGEAWGLLLDQFKRALGNSSDVKTYELLVNSLRESGVAKIPSPTGNDVLTAEVCFNPELFKEGTSYSVRKRSETILGDNSVVWGSDQTDTYLNEKISNENDVQFLTQKNLNHLISFHPNSFPSVGNFSIKLSVDFKEKSVSQISNIGSGTSTLTGEMFLDRAITYEGSGNKVIFTTEVGSETSTSYIRNVLAVFAENGSETQREEEHYEINDKRTFKGLTNINRGKTRRACEFEVKRKGVRRLDSTVFEGVFSEYYLVGVGLDVTSEDIESIKFKDEEI